MSKDGPYDARIVLWPLPLVAGALMCIGATTAAWLSMHLELTPACNPLLEGCVSVSRAGRYGLANIVFRGLLLPSAVLQAITWWMCGCWLRSHLPRLRAANWLPWLGIFAGIFLCLYASFLGTEGGTYRWLRQYGTVFYFGLSYLCMLILLRSLRRLSNAPRNFASVLQSLCAGLLLLGLSNTLLAQLFDDPLKDQIENITEWWLGIGYFAVFILIAELWRRMRVLLTWPQPQP